MIKKLYYYLREYFLIGYKWQNYLVLNHYSSNNTLLYSYYFQILTRQKNVNFRYQPIPLIDAKDYKIIKKDGSLDIILSITKHTKSSFFREVEPLLKYR